MKPQTPITLVTGASGFLGGALARRIVERGERVRVLARPTSRLGGLADLPVEVALGSLEDGASLAAALRGVGTLYHCAGLTTDWGPWGAFYEANVAGVERLLRAAEQADSLRRVLHVSTTDVHGYRRQAPPESAPFVDVGLPYNRSKGLGEAAVWAFHRRTGIPTTVVRPASIYGPGSKDFVLEIARALQAGQMLLVRGGRAPAGLLYIQNAVDAIVAAATSSVAVGRAYTLRDEAPTTWRTYADALADAVGARRPMLSLPEPAALASALVTEQVHRMLRRPGRPLLTRHAVLLLSRPQDFPIARARADLGVQSRVSFEEGLARSAAWASSQG